MILISALATIDSDSKPTVTLTEQWLIIGGVAMLIGPSLVSTDPLSDEERAKLVGGGGEGLGVAAAPLLGGGSVTIGGRF